MKIAVITGGGADGAFTVGRLKVLDKDYDKAVCVSTGSLMGGLVLLKDYDKLTEAYVDTNTSDITERSAFKSDGSINVKKAIFNTLRSYAKKSPKTLGESKNLRKRIESFLTESNYSELFEKKKEVIVTCFSMSNEETVYFSNLEQKFENFKDWMWASSNPPIVFSLLDKPRKEGGINEQWVDGGVGTINPLKKAILMGGTEIDVFMHQPKPLNARKKDIKNVPHFVSRLLKSFYKNGETKDLESGLMLAELNGIKVNVYWMPIEYYDNSLVFGRDKMLNLLYLGEKHALENIDTYDYSKKK